MAELKDTAEQFARDLIAQNIAGLMMAFTPAGMGKAMALQGQMAAAGGGAGQASSFEINDLGKDGETHSIDIVMKGAAGDATLFTKWVESAGAWKVDDIGLKS